MKPLLFGFSPTLILVISSYILSCSEAYYSLANNFPLSAKLLPQPVKVHACYNEDKSQVLPGASNSTDTTCSYRKMKTASLDLLSSDGVIEIVFNVPSVHCNLTSLELKLRVNDSISSPDECRKTALAPEGTNIHSTKTVLLSYENCQLKNCSNSCEKEIQISFRYIFTGCYQLWIMPYSGQNSLKAVVSSPTFVTTKFSKKKMSQYEVPIIKTKYIMDNDAHGPTLIANAYFEDSFFDSEQLFMSFLLLSHVDLNSEMTMCYKTGVQQSNCLILWSNSHGITECETKGIKEKEYSACSIEDRHRLDCQFFGIKPGHYCVRVDLWDERCSSGTIWSLNSSHSEPCSWYHQFVAVESDTVKVIDIPDPHWSVSLPYVLLLIGAISFVCLVVFFGAWSSNRMTWRNVNKLFLLKNNPSYESQYTVSFTPTPDKLKHIVSLQPTILLVYARDCQLFMDAMVSFRNVLRNVANCQVYDCWDSNHWEKVAESAYDWVIGLASDPSVRIIVVSSEMATLVETSLQHTAPIKYRYRHPECFDNIFIFALKYIVANTITNSYKRVFITRLDGFPPEGTRFTSLNPHTIYCLPDHLQLLMSAIHHLGSKEFSVKESDEGDISRFKKIVEELKQFYLRDPRYICRMIDKS